jgi:hypothetical protein
VAKRLNRAGDEAEVWHSITCSVKQSVSELATMVSVFFVPSTTCYDEIKDFVSNLDYPKIALLDEIVFYL